ncbi:MAG: 50S ribosomal protein L9 [Bacteroidales bacterium]|jgi:large subunit ribosomal protein L9|nr:50S ribosomal protein L9 [Bacteroidales bacterium]
MEIILKQDVRNLGHKDDIVNVKNGYAVNYLIPRGMATIATVSAKKVLAENTRQRAHKEAKLIDDAKALAAKLEGIKVTIATKVSNSGKIYGSVNSIQIADALAAKGFDIDRKSIEVADDKIQEIGEYNAKIGCYKNIYATVNVEVVDEDASEKEKAE